MVDKKELYNYIDEYNELQKLEKSLKNRKDQLKAKIIANMQELGEKLIESDTGVSATLTFKETIKYTDEFAIIKYLKKNNLDEYITTGIDTKFNSKLKESNSLSEALADSFTITEVNALTVKNS